jgi:putative oxidoreductase
MTPLDFGLLILRVVIGGTMFAHGAQKAFGWWNGPGVDRWRQAVGGMGFQPVGLWAGVSIVAELTGILLVLGFLTPVAAAIVLAQAIVIIGHAHLAKGFWNTQGGYEFPLSLAGGAAALLFTGPGAVSIDALTGVGLTDTGLLALFLLGIAGGLLGVSAPRLLAREAEATDGRRGPDR